MSATDKLIDAFESLLSGNFLSSSTDIRRFLTTVAEDGDLRSAMTASVDKFRPQEEYDRVFYERQSLPDRPEKTVAIVTAFLYRVDANRVSLSDELARLYPGLDSAAAYKSFCDDFLRPYAESFVTILCGEATEEIPEKTSVYDKMNEDLTSILTELERALPEQPIPEPTLNELTDAVRGMKYALSFDDAILTAFAYRRIAYLLEQNGLSLAADRSLASTLKLYGVL